MAPGMLRPRPSTSQDTQTPTPTLTPQDIPTPTPTSDRVQGITASLESIRASVGPQLQKIWEHLPDNNLQLTIKWFILDLLILTVGTAAFIIFTWGAVLAALVAPFVFVFSPILVALGGFLIVVAAVVLTVLAAGYAAYYVAFWVYKYLNGAQPVYSGYVDAAGNRIADAAHEVRRWALLNIPGHTAAESA